WPLTALQQGALAESGGTLSLDAALTGPLLALNGSATLRADGLIAGERAIGRVEVDAVATRGRWEWSTALFDGLVRLRGRLTPDAGWPLVVDGEWNEANFGPLLAPDTDVAAISTGTLNVSLRLTDPTRFDATVALQHLRIVNGAYEVTSVRPARLECRRGACTLNELALRGPDTDLRASGRAGADGSVSLRLEGNGDLRLLELAGDAVESARGGFTLDLEVHRARNRWDVDGQVRFDKAALDVGGPAAITRASGRLTLRGTTVHIDQLDGRIGTGSFAVQGAIDLARGPDLTWTLTDVGVDLLPSLEAELSGRGGFDGVWEHMRLSGEIDIARMLYDRDIQLLDFLPTLNRELADAPRPPAARRLDLDLHIVAPGELYIENNIARIEARADLRVTGTADRPQLYGRIEALDGTVTVSSRVFELQGGTVDFRPELGLTAALNITLESTIDTRDATYVVDVRVTGTTREPRVVMSSDDPSLSPTDVATLVAVGQTATQFSQGGDAGFSIGLPGVLADPLQQGARQLLPIDRITFESTYSRSTGTFEPQIKLGRDLTDEIAVSLGQTFGLESRTSVEAEYRLTPRVFLTASWESQTSSQEGAFGAGARVRYEFWRVTPYTMLMGWR
ncbi:MAG: translocation/assembly module TamB domain-containing protein, partial [Candidatus Binatia bacterium]